LSIDVIERRRAVEERLRRARNLSEALGQATGDIAASSGLSIEDLDPDNSLRIALSALAGVAALRPGFDVVVSLPDSPFALRVRHLDDQVDISLIRHGDPPPATDSPPDSPESSAPPAPSESPAPAESPEHEDEDEVVSDLAAMLWQDVGTSPS
jgi:hypothetical protein